MKYQLKSIKIVVVAVLLFLTTGVGFSQSNNFKVGEKREIVLIDGRMIRGLLVAEDLTSYTVEVDGERVVIPKNKIKDDGSIASRDNVIDNYTDYADQYFAMPSALPVGKGNRYYRNIDLFVNIFSFGLTDNFSLNAGAESVSLFVGQVPGFILTPKFSIPISEYIHIGIGSTSFIFNSEVGTTGFTNITIGDASRNVTFGVNFGIGDPDFLDEPIFSLGYMFPLNKKVSLYGEFVYVSDIGTESDVLFDIALRIKNRQGWAFDFGFVSTFEGIDSGAVPAITAIIPF